MGPTCSWPIFLLYCPISFSLHLWLHGKFSTLSGETKRRFEPGRQMVWQEIWLPLQSGELLHNSHFLGQPWRTMMKENSWSGHNLQKCNWLEGEMTRCVIYTTMSGLWPVVWLMVGDLDEIWLETLWLQNLGKKCDEPLWIGKKCKDICVPYECSPTSDISKGKKKKSFFGLPRWCSGKEPACKCRRHKGCGSNPWVGRSPGEGNGMHSSILAWRISLTQDPGWL